jgi:hypothetical protein
MSCDEASVLQRGSLLKWGRVIHMFFCCASCAVLCT